MAESSGLKSRKEIVGKKNKDGLTAMHEAVISASHEGDMRALPLLIVLKADLVH